MNPRAFLDLFLERSWLLIPTLGLIQGLLSTLSLAPYNLPILAWLAPWPLFYLAFRYQDSMRKLFLAGAVSGFWLYAFSFYWLINLFRNFGDMNTPIAMLIFLPATIVLGLKIPVFVMLLGASYRARYRRFVPTRWFTVGVLALLSDYLTPQIFPWYWGNLIAGNNELAQLAEFTGIHGLTFLMFAGSYVYYMAARALWAGSAGGFAGIGAALKRFARKFVLKRILLVPALLLVVFAFGLTRRMQMESRQASLPTTRVAAIQPNAPIETKRLSRVREIIAELLFTRLPTLARQAQTAGQGKVDLLVLPESAVPYHSADDNAQTRYERLYLPQFEVALMLMAYNWNVDVFFNEVTARRETEDGTVVRKAYNSSALYGRDGKRQGFYHKRELLAWGEYVPGVDFLKATGLIKLVPGIVSGARFWPGEASTLIPYMRANGDTPVTNTEAALSLRLMPAKNPRELEQEFPADRRFEASGWFMPLICYEILKPNLIRSFFHESGKNPDFLVNITQDGWYGDTIETYQHYELGRIRAIETRRAIVRAVNSGTSGFVDIAGNYVTPLVGPRFTHYNTTDIQIWDVPINRDAPTLYVRFGDLWILVLSGFFALVIVFRVYRSAKFERA